ncbi:hypothetical protein [Shigella boydii]|uniref:hypothetical protein n=1 Tax=Shigella boydii TaxID=621 RepID=UPI00338F0646
MARCRLAIGVLAGPLGKTASWFFPPDRINECCQGSASTMGNGDGFRSLLGGAIGALFSPVGLIVAALAGAAVLIWKYWDPIRAFLPGCSAGLWKG